MGEDTLIQLLLQTYQIYKVSQTKDKIFPKALSYSFIHIYVFLLNIVYHYSYNGLNY